MFDKEKVINGLKHCKIGNCVGCPYDQIREESLHGKHDKWELVCNEQLTEDILALLKEQESMVKPTKCHCGELFDAKDSSFCPKCGCAYGELSGRYTNIGR